MVADPSCYRARAFEIDGRAVQVSRPVEAGANISQGGTHPCGITQRQAAAQALMPKSQRRLDSRAAEHFVAREAETIRRDLFPAFGRGPRLEPGDAAHEERITPSHRISPS